MIGNTTCNQRIHYSGAEWPTASASKSAVKTDLWPSRDTYYNATAANPQLAAVVSTQNGMP